MVVAAAVAWHRLGQGGATRLLEGKGRGTSVAEGSDPRANGVGVQFQCLGYRRCGPALDQEPESMPPFALPRFWRSIHAFPYLTYIQLPPFKELHYVPDTHHRHPTALTEYRNSSASFALCGLHLDVSLERIGRLRLAPRKLGCLEEETRDGSADSAHLRL